MNRYAKASAPVLWPGPRTGKPDDGGKSRPSPRLTQTLSATENVRGPAALMALPRVPPAGCRGKALLNIPKAMGRPPIAGTPRVVRISDSSPQAAPQATISSILPYRPSASSTSLASSAYMGKGTKESLMLAVAPTSLASSSNAGPHVDTGY